MFHPIIIFKSEVMKQFYAPYYLLYTYALYMTSLLCETLSYIRGFAPNLTPIAHIPTLMARFMGPTWGPPESCRPQMGLMLTPWTLLSEDDCFISIFPWLCVCEVCVIKFCNLHELDIRSARFYFRGYFAPYDVCHFIKVINSELTLVRHNLE